MGTPSTKEKVTALIEAVEEADNRLTEVDGALVVTAAAADGGEEPWWVNNHQVAGVDVGYSLLGILNNLRQVKTGSCGT